MLPQLKDQKKKKVAAYARVSTSQEIQLNSLQNQREYYLEKIKNNEDWEFAGIYLDEGISGTSTKGRNGIKELIKKSKKGEVDLILCKSISRFARNTADLLKTTRALKKYGTEVIFEKENLSTVSGDGELMLSLMGVFAQTESESISSNIKWRIQKDREQGISTPHPKVLGYEWVDEKLKINKEEAKVIKEIYERYEDGESGRKIAKELNEKIKNPKEPTPSSIQNRHFDSTSIYYILRNPVYAGDLLMGKYYTTSPINGKIRKNKGERDMYLVEDDHEAIIEKERWEEIQEEIKERTEKARNKRQKNKEIKERTKNANSKKNRK